MGTSSTDEKRSLTGEDHPHAYGDKYSRKTGRREVRGSSPRVWGQALAVYDSTLMDGIIPTRMGTRSVIWVMITVT